MIFHDTLATSHNHTLFYLLLIIIFFFLSHFLALPAKKSKTRRFTCAPLDPTFHKQKPNLLLTRMGAAQRAAAGRSPREKIAFLAA